MERVKSFCKTKVFIYFLLALFCLLLACLSKDYDYDLFARLIVGEKFVEAGQIAYEDFLSYTPTHLWYDHEWGSGVVFYLMLKHFGAFGLTLVHAITMFFTVFFVIKTQELQKHTYPLCLSFVILFTLLFSHLNPSIVRCHMFSFMFFAMFLYFLEKTRKTGSNIIWLVAPITIIWNNLHGGIVSGLGMIFIYMVGELISRRPWKKLFLVLFVSTPLLVINPYGVDYLNFLFSANTKDREYITEWWSVFANRHVIYYYPAFVFGVCGLAASFERILSKRKIDITHTIALITTVTLGILHVKLLSIAVIVIAALYSNTILRLFEKGSLKNLNKLAYVIVVMAILYLPFTKPVFSRVDFKKFPVKECEFLKINNIKGNLLTTFGLGSYTSYKLYPQNLIYMDGRYEEVYNDIEFERLINFEKAADTWYEVFTEYPTQILMPEKTNPGFEHMKKQKEWQLVYEGECAGVFVPKPWAKKEYKMPSDDINYYKSTAFENFGEFGKNGEY